MRKKFIYRFILITLIVIGVDCFDRHELYGRFLSDQKVEEYGWTDDANEQPDQGFPPDIATNIKVVPLKGYYNSVKITWNISNNTADSFIVARTTILPDTPEKALKAVSIKVVKPDEDRLVLDENLAEGKYYYLILAKEKIKDKKIELYPNENYTATPLVIMRSQPVVESKQPLVNNINAVLIDRRNVFVSWSYFLKNNVTYLIYRGEQQLSSQEYLRNAVRIGVVKDLNSFTDNTILKSGVYYYAITILDKRGGEIFALQPDVSYTVKGLKVQLPEKKSSPLVEKKVDIPEVVKEIPKPIAEKFNDIDILLSKTFFKRNYIKSIEELRNFIAYSSSPHQVLKARLFLARAYLESGRYQEALKQLVRKDVMKKYPKQSKFWRDYCFTKIK